MVRKKRVDEVTPLIEAQLPGLVELAGKKGKLQEAVEGMLALEKKARLAEDADSTKKVAQAIIDACVAQRDLKAVSDNVVLLSKRRGQLISVVTLVVKAAVAFLDTLSNKDEMKTLIATLRTVCEGKMHVELERARLTMILAKMLEEEGKMSEAAETLQEIQVETYGSMDKREKAHFILEQVRLCLACKDLVRAGIIAKKVNNAVLNVDGFEELKIKYNTLMVELAGYHDDYLRMARCLLSTHHCESVQADEARRVSTLQNGVLYLLLAPYDNDKSDLMFRTLRDNATMKTADAMAPYAALLTLFTTDELIRWEHLSAQYGAGLRALSVFSAGSGGSGKGDARWAHLRERVTEHNVRIVALHYSQIRLVRMAELLGLSGDETERAVAAMVTSGSVYARMDRPNGVVSFVKAKRPEEVLNEWSGNISKLLSVLEKTCHAVNKELVIHKVKK